MTATLTPAPTFTPCDLDAPLQPGQHIRVTIQTPGAFYSAISSHFSSWRRAKAWIAEQRRHPYKQGDVSFALFTPGV